MQLSNDYGDLMHFQRRQITLSKLFLFCSEKRSALKGKNLLHMGASSYFFRLEPLFRSRMLRTAKRKSKKLAVLSKMAGNLHMYQCTFNYFFIKAYVVGTNLNCLD